MTASVACPNCGKLYRVAEENLGSHAQCKNCGRTFTLSIAADKTKKAKATWKAKKRASARAAESPRPSGGSEGDVLPRTIGHYAVKKKLGAGGMGEVWLAYDPNLDRDVAIKVLAAEFSRDKARLERFLRQARLAARLEHANTVTVYQAGMDGNRAFIAMQFVDGGSLEKAVAARGRLDWREATRAIRDAAAGLAAAHQVGLVHRDVKPANLMRTTDGNTKVVDFGLARAQIGDTQLTQRGMLLGTPAYMSPEQCMGKKVDHRSDLYSLICTYYYLLTGRVPFVGQSVPSLTYQHCHEPFPDPRQLVPALPGRVCRILARGSQKDPAGRYQSGEELVADLEALLASPQEPLVSHPPRQQLPSLAGVDVGPPKGRDPLYGQFADPEAPVRMVGVPRRRHAARAGRSFSSRSRAWKVGGGVAAAILLVLMILYIMPPNHGTVTIIVENLHDDTQVMIDGETIDHAELGEPLKLRAGEYVLEVISPGVTPISYPFTVPRGGEITRSVSLPKSPRSP